MLSDLNLDSFWDSAADLFDDKASTTNNTQALYREKLRFESGKQYVVRLLPYLIEGPEGQSKSRFRFTQYTWKSTKTGKMQYVLSPATFHEPCAMSDWYWNLQRTNKELFTKLEAEKKFPGYRQLCLYNVYVVNDPTNPENNGKVKILEAGAQLDAVIQAAVTKDPAKVREFQEEFDVERMDRAVFDLSAKGLNLVIDAQGQGNFRNYKASRFTRRNRDLGLDDEQQEAIYRQVYDLTKVERRMSAEDVEKLFYETYAYANATSAEAADEAGDATALEAQAGNNDEALADVVSWLNKDAAK